VIAPLMTSPTSVLRQTIYYPYAWALQHARGQVLDLQVESETYPIRAEGLRADFARDEHVPFLDVVATLDAQNGRLAVFMLNRDLDSDRELTLDLAETPATRVISCETITGRDLKAANSFERPTNVVPQRLEPPQPGRRMTFRLPARSYSIAVLGST
jgi:alpha-N-arabinofuranosidase